MADQSEKKLKKRDIERLENTSIATPLLDNSGMEVSEDICGVSTSCGVSDVCAVAVTSACVDNSTACVDDSTACVGDATACVDSNATACSGDTGTACNDSVTGCGNNSNIATN